MLLLSVPLRQDADNCILYLLQGHANRYKRHIVPMLSLSVDFYVRVFVRVYTSPAAVKDSATKLMHVYQSLGCDSFFMQRVGRKVGCCQGPLRVTPALQCTKGVYLSLGCNYRIS